MRHWIGRLPLSPARDRLTATWQFSVLPQLAAVLSRHPDRVRTLFGQAGIVNDPVAPAIQFQCRLNNGPDFPQHGAIRPGRLGHEMMPRLVLGLHVQRIKVRRQRLHALAFDRQHQTSAVIQQNSAPISVTQHTRQLLKIPLQFFVDSHDATLAKEEVWIIGVSWG